MVARQVQDLPAPPPSDERVVLARERARIAAWLGDGLRLTKVQTLLEPNGVTSSYATLRLRAPHHRDRQDRGIVTIRIAAS